MIHESDIARIINAAHAAGESGISAAPEIEAMVSLLQSDGVELSDRPRAAISDSEIEEWMTNNPAPLYDGGQVYGQD